MAHDLVGAVIETAALGEGAWLLSSSSAPLLKVPGREQVPVRLGHDTALAYRNFA